MSLEPKQIEDWRRAAAYVNQCLDEQRLPPDLAPLLHSITMAALPALIAEAERLTRERNDANQDSFERLRALYAAYCESIAVLRAVEWRGAAGDAHGCPVCAAPAAAPGSGQRGEHAPGCRLAATLQGNAPRMRTEQLLEFAVRALFAKEPGITPEEVQARVRAISEALRSAPERAPLTSTGI